MQSILHAAPLSPKSVWTGRILTGLAAAFLAFDAIIKVIKIQPVTDSFVHLGYSDSLALGIGLLELACTALYVAPRTAVLGAVLLTGFLGGATTTHLRIGEPFWFPLVFGALVWAGLLLRDERARVVLPSRD